MNRSRRACGKNEIKKKKLIFPIFASIFCPNFTHFVFFSLLNCPIPIPPLFSALCPPPSLSLTGGHLLSCSFIQQTGPSFGTVVWGVKRKKKKETSRDGRREGCGRWAFRLFLRWQRHSGAIDSSAALGTLLTMECEILWWFSQTEMDHAESLHGVASALIRSWYFGMKSVEVKWPNQETNCQYCFTVLEQIFRRLDFTWEFIFAFCFHSQHLCTNIFTSYLSHWKTCFLLMCFKVLTIQILLKVFHLWQLQQFFLEAELFQLHCCVAQHKRGS